MAATPEQLINQAARHQVYLEGQKAHSVNDVLELMREMEDKIVSRLSRSDITAFNRSRLERLLQAINGIMEDYYDGDLSGLWAKQLEELGVYEAGFETRSLDNVTVNYDFDLPSDTQIISAIYTNPLTMRGPDNGKLLESFYNDWTQGQKNRVVGAIRSGFAMGETTQQVVRQLMQEDFVANRRTMSNIIRTSMQHASQHARQITWERNSDIVKQVEWVSALDDRTSTLCRTLDGQKFPLDEGPRPPAHVSCRSTTVAALDERFSIFDKDATRRAKDEDGVTSVSAKETYYSWLKKQPKSFQDSVLGPARGRLLRNGGLSAARFAELQLNKNFKPLTLDEMRKLEPVAFEKAGLTERDEPAPTPKRSNLQYGGDFVPARNNREATQRFRDLGVETVKLRGLDIKYVNPMLEAFEKEAAIAPLTVRELAVANRPKSSWKGQYTFDKAKLEYNKAKIVEDYEQGKKRSVDDRAAGWQEQIDYVSQFLGTKGYNQKKIRQIIRDNKKKIASIADRLGKGEDAKAWSTSYEAATMEESIFSTTVHELGHHRHDKDLKGNLFFAWDKTTSPTEYGESDQYEYLAEWFTRIRLNGEEGAPTDMLEILGRIGNDND